MDWAVVFLSDLTDEIKKKIEKLLLLARAADSLAFSVDVSHEQLC